MAHNLRRRHLCAREWHSWGCNIHCHAYWYAFQYSSFCFEFLEWGCICRVDKILTFNAAGRAIQGIGGAGVSVFGNVIVSDLTSVRERSKYMSIVFASLGVGLALGPPVGGIMAEHDWRWVFVCAFFFFMLLLITHSVTLSSLTRLGLILLVLLVLEGYVSKSILLIPSG